MKTFIFSLYEVFRKNLRHKMQKAIKDFSLIFINNNYWQIYNHQLVVFLFSIFICKSFSDIKFISEFNKWNKIYSRCFSVKCHEHGRNLIKVLQVSGSDNCRESSYPVFVLASRTNFSLLRGSTVNSY